MRHIDTNIHRLIRPYLQSGALLLDEGTRHAKIRHPRSRDFLPLAGSPSDHRAFKNFSASLRRLVERGEGFIFSKTGRLPEGAMTHAH